MPRDGNCHNDVNWLVLTLWIGESEQSFMGAEILSRQARRDSNILRGYARISAQLNPVLIGRDAPGKLFLCYQIIPVTAKTTMTLSSGYPGGFEIAINLRRRVVLERVVCSGRGSLAPVPPSGPKALMVGSRKNTVNSVSRQNPNPPAIFTHRRYAFTARMVNPPK
jgi:hypothetical protein